VSTEWGPWALVLVLAAAAWLVLILVGTRTTAEPERPGAAPEAIEGLTSVHGLQFDGDVSRETSPSADDGPEQSWHCSVCMGLCAGPRCCPDARYVGRPVGTPFRAAITRAAGWPGEFTDSALPADRQPEDPLPAGMARAWANSGPPQPLSAAELVERLRRATDAGRPPPLTGAQLLALAVAAVTPEPARELASALDALAAELAELDRALSAFRPEPAR